MNDTSPNDIHYKITRFYSPADGRPSEIMRSGLTLEEAQEHCFDQATHEEGVWFDGYTQEMP